MKTTIIEANEISPFILHDYCSKFPQSTLAELSRGGQFISTYAEDAPHGFLYPAHTWASMNSGTPYREHKVFRYNDPKDNCKLVYEELLKEFSLGMVSSLHTEALQTSDTEKLRFLIPDSYATSSYAKPIHLSHFQRFKLSQTRLSSRVSRLGLGDGSLTDAIFSAFQFNPNTHRKILSEFVSGKRKGLGERMRNIDFILHSDLFLKLRQTHQPDVSVFFTNHVAAQMHRYMFAAYPKQFKNAVYPQAWVDKHRFEIDHAVSLLDQFLSQLLKGFDAKLQTLIIATSMGQMPLSHLTHDDVGCYSGVYVTEPARFLSKLIDQGFRYRTLGAMVPQISIELPIEGVEIMKNYLGHLDCDGLRIFSMWSGNILTLTVQVSQQREYKINGRCFTAKQLGLSNHAHADSQNTGGHHPLGSLLIYGKAPSITKEISYLEYKQIVKTIVAN